MGASVHASQLPAAECARLPAPRRPTRAEPEEPRRAAGTPRHAPHLSRAARTTGNRRGARERCSLTLQEGPMQEDDVTPGNPAPHSHTQGKAGSDLHTHALRSHAHIRAYGTWLLAPALARTRSCSCVVGQWRPNLGKGRCRRCCLAFRPKMPRAQGSSRIPRACRRPSVPIVRRRAVKVLQPSSLVLMRCSSAPRGRRSVRRAQPRAQRRVQQLLARHHAGGAAALVHHRQVAQAERAEQIIRPQHAE